MTDAAKPLHWWETSTVLLFGIVVPVLPTALSMLALWVGREIARDPKRKLTKRQTGFLNLGLMLITFLAVTGRMPWQQGPLEVGMATIIGFGIGMNGLVIFELFERWTYNMIAARAGQKPPDSAPRE